MTFNIADGEAVLVHLGVRVDCVQADQLPGDALRHLLRAQPHRPQRREVKYILICKLLY